jgi:hypothetical protein
VSGLLPLATLAAYRLWTAAGQTHEISRSFKNVQDPYLEMGQLFRHLAPNTIGTTMPAFPHHRPDHRRVRGKASSGCLSGRMASMADELYAGRLERAGRASGRYVRDAIRSRLIW